MPAIQLRSSYFKGTFICARVHCNVSPSNMVSSGQKELNISPCFRRLDTQKLNEPCCSVGNNTKM